MGHSQSTKIVIIKICFTIQRQFGRCQKFQRFCEFMLYSLSKSILENIGWKNTWNIFLLPLSQLSIAILLNKPLMLTAAKSNLTILMKPCRQKQSWENIWMRNVIQNITNNSPSKIFCKLNLNDKVSLKSIHRSRRQFLEELLWNNGLTSCHFLVI